MCNSSKVGTSASDTGGRSTGSAIEYQGKNEEEMLKRHELKKTNPELYRSLLLKDAVT